MFDDSWKYRIRNVCFTALTVSFTGATVAFLAIIIVVAVRNLL